MRRGSVSGNPDVPARRRRFRLVRWACVFLLAVVSVGGLLVLSGARPPDQNFSQYPGFAEYFTANPPSSVLPTAEERALLEEHRPRFFLPDGHAGMIGFYEDYVAQGELRAGDGELVAKEVSRELLNAHKEDPRAVFTHRPAAAQSQQPVVFARIDYQRIEYRGIVTELKFLTYHAVFRHSGLVAGLKLWQMLPAAILGDLDDWHQLDHYTSATLILTTDDRPLALMLQQHNYLHTYLLGEAYELPEDGRPEVDVAIRSNELYPHTDGRREHRSVRFPDDPSMRYLLGAGEGPWLAAHDITEPAEEAEYRLAFLEHDDAFYTFKGFLGERRVLPGRDSPPGADYNTLPRFKPLETQMLLGYWREGHEGDIARFEASILESDWGEAFVAAQREVFFANFFCLRRGQENCSLE